MSKNICFLVLLISLLVSCDSGNNNDYPPSQNTVVFSEFSFSASSPQSVTAGREDLVVLLTGSPAGGTFTLDSQSDPSGTGGVFSLVGSTLTFSTSTAISSASGGTVTATITYTPTLGFSVTQTYSVAVSAPAPRLYATIVEDQGSCGGCGDATLYTIDPTTGTLTLVGPLGGSVNGLAFANGRLYGTTATFDTQGSVLLEINPTTGAISTVIGQIVDGGVDDGGVSPCGSINDLAFDSTNGVMYAVGNDCDSDNESPHLFSINLSTGAATDLGEITGMASGTAVFYGGNSLAYDASNDRLYYGNYSSSSATTNPSQVALYELNRTTATVISTAMIDTTDYCGRPSGMGVDDAGSIFITRNSGCGSIDFGSLTTAGVFTSINADLTTSTDDHVEAIAFGF